MPRTKQARVNLYLPIELNQRLELYMAANPLTDKTKIIKAAIQAWLDQQEAK